MLPRFQLLCLFLYILIRTVVLARVVDLQRKSDNHIQHRNKQNQWIYEAIHVADVWKLGYTGESIRVRINNGRQGESSDTEWLTKDSCDDDPQSQWTLENKSYLTANSSATTIAASILGDGGENHVCGKGIAPRTALSVCNYLTGRINTSTGGINNKSKSDREQIIINSNSNSNSNVLSSKFSAENPPERRSVPSTNSFDISINLFENDGCVSERRIIGLHYSQDKSNSSRITSHDDDNHEMCPFRNTPQNEWGPCRYCSQSDHDTVNGMNTNSDRYNIFEPISKRSTTKTSLVRGERTVRGVSNECAISVRDYCSRYFHLEEDLCTRWIRAIDLHGEGSRRCRFETTTRPEAWKTLNHGAKEGRGGKGIIFVYASEDSHGNAAPHLKSRFAMIVDGIKIQTDSNNDNDGDQSLPTVAKLFQQTTSPVFVVAPGGEDHSKEIPHRHLRASEAHNSDNSSSCVQPGYGASVAAPIVGGVVALMLEANKKLTYRDVRSIIAKTSRPVFEDDLKIGFEHDTTFEINAAGFGYSDHYGFGLIDASKAVRMAKRWRKRGRHAPPELSITAFSGVVNLEIFDDPFCDTTSTLTVYENNTGINKQKSFLESVGVYLKLRYFNRGNLRITLRSPSGTISVLSQGGRNDYGQLGLDGNCDDEWWEFATLRNWGESPYGVWKLSITDTLPGNGDVVCVDRPGYVLPLQHDHDGDQDDDALKRTVTMTCEDFTAEDVGFCKEGQIFEDGCNEAPMKASSACCACGGGILPHSDELGKLEEWKIVLGDGSPKMRTRSTTTSDVDATIPSRTHSEDAAGIHSGANDSSSSSSDQNGEHAPSAMPSPSPSRLPLRRAPREAAPSTAVPTRAPTAPPTFEMQDRKSIFKKLFGFQLMGGEDDKCTSKPKSILPCGFFVNLLGFLTSPFGLMMASLIGLMACCRVSLRNAEDHQQARIDRYRSERRLKRYEAEYRKEKGLQPIGSHRKDNHRTEDPKQAKIDLHQRREAQYQRALESGSSSKRDKRRNKNPKQARIDRHNRREAQYQRALESVSGSRKNREMFL